MKVRLKQAHGRFCIIPVAVAISIFVSLFFAVDTLAVAPVEELAAQSAAAEVPEVTQGTVTAFRDSSLAPLYPVPGTPEAELALPTHLNATVGDAAVRIPIKKWTCTPPYSENEGGPFVFVPVLPEGILVGQLEVPTVTVIPGGQIGQTAIVGSVVEAGDFGTLKAILTDKNAQPGDSNFTVNLTADITVTEPLTLPAGKTVTLQPLEESAVVLRRGFEGGAMLTVPTDASGETGLFLQNVVLSGEGVAATGPLLSNGGTTVVSDGARIVANNNTATPGGGVFNKGTLTVRDAEISGNNASSGAAIHNAGHLVLGGNVYIPGPGGIAIAAATNVPVADTLTTSSQVSIERSAAFAPSGPTAIAKALSSTVLTESNLSNFTVSGGGFTYELSNSKDALNALPIEYAVKYVYDTEKYSNPSANLGKMNVFSPLLTLIAPSPTGKSAAHFLGWYTAEQEGTRVDTLAPSNLTTLSDANNEIVLYARFAEQAPQIFTLNYLGFDAAKYQHNNPASLLAGESLVLGDLFLLNTTTSETAFLGWFTAPEGGEQVKELTAEKAAELADASGQILLYARWVPGSPAAAAAPAVSQPASSQPAQPVPVAPGTKPAVTTPAAPNSSPSDNNGNGNNAGGNGGNNGNAEKPAEQPKKLPPAAPGAR